MVRRPINPVIVRFIAILILAAPILLAAEKETVKKETKVDKNDILVVVNLGVKQTSLSLTQLRSIFLQKNNAWQDGSKVVPIHPKDSTLRARFAEHVLGFSLAQEKEFWQKEILRKGTQPPPAFKSNLKAIFKIRGAITYLYRHQYIEGVSRVILEIK